MVMKKAMLISCFDWYEKRLRVIGAYLSSLAYEVFYVSSDYDHLKKEYNQQYNDIQNFIYIHVPDYKSNISIRRVYSHKVFTDKVVRLIDDYSPDLVYCLVPPNLLVKKISKIKHKKNFKLVYDIIDLWPESFPSKKKNNFMLSVWKRFRDDYISYADCIVLECDYYRKYINSDILNKKVKFLPIMKEKIKSKEKLPHEGDICLCYLGSINSLIDIDEIVKIIDRLRKKYKVVMRIIGGGNNKDEFIKKMSMNNVDVQYYGKVFDDVEKKRILSSCDFGLNIYRSNIAVGITLKSVDYFQLGIPIINNIPGDTGRLVSEYNVGVNIDDYYKMDVDNLLKKRSYYRENVNDMFSKIFCIKGASQKLSFLKEI